MIMVLQNLAEFSIFVLVAMFVQNAVFARGFGASRLVKLVADPSVDTMIFCALLCLVQVLAAPFGFVLNKILKENQLWYASYIRPFGLVVCTAFAFFIVFLIIKLFNVKGGKELLAILPMASFNCTVMGPMLISSTQNYTFVQAMGFALGSGLGYVFAVLIVTEGQTKIQNWKVPRTFRGLPINLLYIGILALAIYGLTGHRLVV